MTTRHISDVTEETVLAVVRDPRWQCDDANLLQKPIERRSRVKDGQFSLHAQICPPIQ